MAILAQATLIFSLGNSLNFESLKWGGVIVTAPLTSTSAIFGGLLAFFVLDEVFNWEMFGGMALAIVGVYVLTRGQVLGTPVSEHWERAIMLSLIGAVATSLGGVLLTYALRREVDIFVAMLLSTGTAIFSMVFILGMQGQIYRYWTSSPGVVRDLLLAGVINTISLLSITYALALSPWAIVTSISRLSVILAPLAAVLFLDEKLNSLMLFGIVLVVIGVICVQWGQARGK